MDNEEIIEELLKILLSYLRLEHDKIDITEEENNTYNVNIISSDPSLLIGYRGNNIQALQHLLKVLAWKRTGSEEQFHIFLDIDNYRKRQEENVISLAERKVAAVRKNGRAQHLPPMSPYFRRKVHLHLMGAAFDDIETFSNGTGDRRHIVIQSKR